MKRATPKTKAPLQRVLVVEVHRRGPLGQPEITRRYLVPGDTLTITPDRVVVRALKGAARPRKESPR